MEKIILTETELKVMQEHIDGKINPTAPTAEQTCLIGVIDRAHKLLNEIGDEAYDDMFENCNCDLIVWYLKMYKKQETK